MNESLLWGPKTQESALDMKNVDFPVLIGQIESKLTKGDGHTIAISSFQNDKRALNYEYSDRSIKNEEQPDQLWDNKKGGCPRKH